MPSVKTLSPADYISSLPPERQRAIATVRRVIKQHLPRGYVETTQYGMISYVVPLSAYPEGYLGKKDVPLPYLCLASQKSHLAVYLMSIYGDQKLASWFTAAWKKTGKKLDMGKSCLRFKAVEDLALDVLGEAVARVPMADYIALYAGNRGGRGKSSAGTKARASAKTKAKAKVKRFH